MDSDLEQMSREQLLAEVRRLRAGIRAHRDSTGHELCWHHPALWGLLPEATDPLPAVPEWPQFLRGCILYRQSLDAQAPDAPRTNETDNLGHQPAAAGLSAEADRVYREWDRACSGDDLDAMIALYAPDAVLESPLIPHLLGTPVGICRGRAEIRALLETAAARKPSKRTFYRAGYFTDGRLLMWEYPRATPDGEQMDFIEVMEIENGLIQRHRVYWGWAGVELIKADAYHK
jgi:ketosteroid isomerase-like protein